MLLWLTGRDRARCRWSVGIECRGWEPREKAVCGGRGVEGRGGVGLGGRGIKKLGGWSVGTTLVSRGGRQWSTGQQRPSPKRP